MTRTETIQKILIVGGGTAGWITAGLLAAQTHQSGANGPKITLIEAPDIPIIGVGEGTWPTMRSTLARMGIQERDFLSACRASFKQGSKFVRWRSDTEGDFYYHPFDLPMGFSDGNLVPYWLEYGNGQSFSTLTCVQEHICERNLSPKQPTSRDYSGLLNYGYHLDAGQFSEFLKRHCTEHLGVDLILDQVTGVESHENGDIRGVRTQKNNVLTADLFIDCTGLRSLLLGAHFGVKRIDKSPSLLVDRAIATQIPLTTDEPIKSVTVSTAQPAGWIWDIALSHRRGVGHVFSSRHRSEDQAYADLQNYLDLDEKAFAAVNSRLLKIDPGYRERFWERNCVAVGLSSGFIEPLEASAIMLVEFAAGLIADQLPASRSAMEVIANRFNRRMTFRWERVVDFLKLHYLLSQRQEDFWRASREISSVSNRLREDLALWRKHPPWLHDFVSVDEPFPAASYQYVLYGMGYGTAPSPHGLTPGEKQFSAAQFETVRRTREQILERLETNRDSLSRLTKEVGTDDPAHVTKS